LLAGSRRPCGLHLLRHEKQGQLLAETSFEPTFEKNLEIAGMLESAGFECRKGSATGRPLPPTNSRLLPSPTAVTARCDPATNMTTPAS
jgi:hypothetical protein